jgi:uncharacterized membrane protein
VTTAEANIDVACDITTVYNQWTQFEDFPQFMEGVDEVTQLDDRHLHWRVSIAGVHRECDATITEQIPEVRVAWKADGDKRFRLLVENNQEATGSWRGEVPREG